MVGESGSTTNRWRKGGNRKLDRVGGARSSHGHRFRPPNLATDAFIKAQRVGGSRRETGQCAHGHQLGYHIPTAGMYQYLELKGTQPWELRYKGPKGT